MDPEYSHESNHPGYETLDFPGPHAEHRAIEQWPRYPAHRTAPLDSTAVLPTQYTTAWNTRNDLRLTPTSPSMPPLLGPMSSPTSEDGYPLISAQPIGLYPTQSQYTWPLHTEIGIRTSAPNAASSTEDEANRQAHNGRILRKLVPQVTYRPARQQRGLEGPRIIEFSVYGEKGVRLSDALEENWVGLEGRDDRSLFGDDRVQIMIRLHIVGCQAWQSKIYTTDHTARRQPISRTKLVYEVAKNVRKFLEREKANGHGDYSRCGWGDVSLKDMYLTRLHRVSEASWQPEVFVEESPTATTPALLPPA